MSQRKLFSAVCVKTSFIRCPWYVGKLIVIFAVNNARCFLLLWTSVLPKAMAGDHFVDFKIRLSVTTVQRLITCAFEIMPTSGRPKASDSVLVTIYTPAMTNSYEGRFQFYCCAASRLGFVTCSFSVGLMRTEFLFCIWFAFLVQYILFLIYFSIEDYFSYTRVESLCINET